MTLPQAKQIGAAPPVVYGASGVIAGCKFWSGESVTTSGGAWSMDLSKAGFTAAPQVTAQALSTATTVAASATAILTARSATAASGFVNLPAAIALGGLADQRAGAGITVMVHAVGA